jgi:hypothetical protein
LVLTPYLRPGALIAAFAPAAALLFVAGGRADDAEVLFGADLAALVAAALVGGFLAPTVRSALGRVAVAGVLAGAAHGVAAGSFDRAPLLALVVLAVAAAASGLGALGRRLGTPSLAAGAVAAGVLGAGMTGLWWADDVAEAVPPPRRHALKQAVLHVDVATAAAYDVAVYDRFHDPVVYRDVPLATSLVRAPSAAPSALLWLSVGLVTWSAASLLQRRQP